MMKDKSICKVNTGAQGRDDQFQNRASRLTLAITVENPLGPTDALRFLALLHRDATDYVEISRQLYANQTLEEIYERVQQQWPSENQTE